MRVRMAMAMAAAAATLTLLPGAVASAQPVHHASRAVATSSGTPTGSDTPSPGSSTTPPGKSGSSKRTGSGVIIGVLILGAAVLLIRRTTGVRPARWRQSPRGQQPEE